MGGTPVRVECVSELVNTNASLCLVTQLCLTLWDPMGYSLQGSSVHGILQARILERGAISFSRCIPVFM